MTLFSAAALCAALLIGGQCLAQSAAPPVAAKKPHVVTSPNGDREDDYYWLRDDTRKNPEMLDLLKAENAYADAVLGEDRSRWPDKLYGEFVGRIKQDDSSVPASACAATGTTPASRPAPTIPSSPAARAR